MTSYSTWQQSEQCEYETLLEVIEIEPNDLAQEVIISVDGENLLSRQADQYLLNHESVISEGGINELQYGLQKELPKAKNRTSVWENFSHNKQKVDSETETNSEFSEDEFNYKGKPIPPSPMKIAMKTQKHRKKRPFATRLKWQNQSMVKAMQACLEKGMTLRGASKKFNVPYSTLKDRVNGRVVHGVKPGHKTMLSPEEEEDLVQYCQALAKGGFILQYINVRERAKEILQVNQINSLRVRDHNPGQNWLSGFLKRHPTVNWKTVFGHHGACDLSGQEMLCHRLYGCLSNYYCRYELSDKPQCVFSLSIFSMHMCESISLIIAGSAVGKVLPPFVAFHGSRTKLTRIKETFKNAYFVCSEAEGMSDVLLWWFRDLFIPKLGVNHGPCLLLVNRPVKEISLQLFQLAIEHHIHLIALPNQLSPLLNPIDSDLTTKFESHIVSLSHDCFYQSPSIIRFEFAKALWNSWLTSLQPKELAQKFSRNGIFPLQANALSKERIITVIEMLKGMPSSNTLHEGSTSRKIHETGGLSLLSTLSSHAKRSVKSSSAFCSVSADRKNMGSAVTQCGGRQLHPKEPKATDCKIGRNYSRSDALLELLKNCSEQEQVKLAVNTICETGNIIEEAVIEEHIVDHCYWNNSKSICEQVPDRWLGSPETDPCFNSTSNVEVNSDESYGKDVVDLNCFTQLPNSEGKLLRTLQPVNAAQVMATVKNEYIKSMNVLSKHMQVPKSDESILSHVDGKDMDSVESCRNELNPCVVYMAQIDVGNAKDNLTSNGEDSKALLGTSNFLRENDYEVSFQNLPFDNTSILSHSESRTMNNDEH